jgi:hypothetical protein
MILNRFLLGKVSQISFSRNTYVYAKYNFFDLSRVPGSYSYLTRFMLSRFVQDLSKLDLFVNSNGFGAILANVQHKFPTLFNLKISVLYTNSSFHNLFLFLIQGWFSIFFIFLYSGIELGKHIVKLSLIRTVVFKSNMLVSEYLA